MTRHSLVQLLKEHYAMVPGEASMDKLLREIKVLEDCRLSVVGRSLASGRVKKLRLSVKEFLRG